MTIFYLDYENGNDASSGVDWANAWKTFTTGATAARIAAGDIIRVAKSPDPTSLGQTATWTNLSLAVTLTSAVTANINTCDSAWTGSANVTATASATRKEGTNSCSLAIAAGFTTGLIAYKAMASTDFSAYQQVSFWIRSSVAIAASTLTLTLCSDNAGVTAVNTIAVPAIPAASQWQVVTVNTGGALGNAIQSVALNALLDPGTPTILIDNILACKALSDPDSLTLSSLISKNSLAQGGDEAWYGIKSINGTGIQLDSNVNSGQGTGRGYYGTTENVTTYKRETIKTTPVSGTTTTIQEVMDSGTAGNNIQFLGGYNTSNSNQDGETFFDAQNGMGRGLYMTLKSYITTDKLSFCRSDVGIYLSGASYSNLAFTNLGNCGQGIVHASTASKNNTISINSIVNNVSYSSFEYFYNSTLSVSRVYNCEGAGLFFQYTNWANLNIGETSNNTNYGLNLSLYVNNSIIKFTGNGANNNSQYGIGSGFDATNNRIYGLTTSGNGTAGAGFVIGKNYLINATLGEVTKVNSAVIHNFSDSAVYVDNLDTGYSKIYTDGGNIVSEASTLTNGSGKQWKFTTETNTNRQSNYPLRLVIARIAVTASNQVTVSAYFKKGHATNIAAQLVCKGGQLAGVANDVTATAASNTNEQQLTIQFTPTQAGVIEIEAQAYYVAGHSNVIIDGLEVSQV